MSKTRLSKTGQPVMGTTILLHAEGEENGETVDKGWLPVTVVGKLYGKMGSGHLVAIIVRWEDGGRQTIEWPTEYRRAA